MFIEITIEFLKSIYKRILYEQGQIPNAYVLVAILLKNFSLKEINSKPH